VDKVPELNEREQLILQAVVHTYITTAEPVGSRSIVKRYGIDLSPATVRNVMADLEDSGFVQQLHTSSGRVPTNQGYRYYVDYLMRVQELTLAERARLEHEFSEQLNDADEVIRRTCHLLALVSNHAGLVEAPNETDAVVRSVELMALSGARAAVLVADSYGRVRTLMATLDRPMSSAELERLRAFLNDQLRGSAVDRMHRTIEERIERFLDEQRGLAREALSLLSSVPRQRPGQLFLEGKTHLFEQPEFHDFSKAREVMILLDEEDRLLDLLRSGVSIGRGKTAVLIGVDTRGSGFEDISLVAAPYRVGQKPVGVLGVLGPKRMPYSRVTAVVDYTAGLLSRFLTRLAG